MGSTNMVYQFNGDPTQAMDDFTWRSPSFLSPAKKTPLFARVLFEEGDLADYYDAVALINDIIERNAQRIAEGYVDDGDGGSIGGGWGVGWYPIGGSALEEVPEMPVYAGTLGLTLNVYGDGDLKFTKSLYKSGVYRIGGGWRARELVFELIGNVPSVTALDVATSTRELVEGPDDTTTS